MGEFSSIDIILIKKLQDSFIWWSFYRTQNLLVRLFKMTIYIPIKTICTHKNFCSFSTHSLLYMNHQWLVIKFFSSENFTQKFFWKFSKISSFANYTACLRKILNLNTSREVKVLIFCCQNNQTTLIIEILALNVWMEVWKLIMIQNFINWTVSYLKIKICSTFSTHQGKNSSVNF